MIGNIVFGVCRRAARPGRTLPLRFFGRRTSFGRGDVTGNSRATHTAGPARPLLCPPAGYLLA